MRRASQRGVTLIEVLIAVTLLALLSVAMLMAMRVGLNALGKTDQRLMENRRVAGAQRIIEQEIEGMMPVTVLCGREGQQPVKFFEGQGAEMRLVSTFSLQQGWRGRPQILEMVVIPGEEGRGVRLVVNEIPYAPTVAGALCTGIAADPETGMPIAKFPQVQHGPASFVLADKLEFCRFQYLLQGDPGQPDVWRPTWSRKPWPVAVRIELAPLEVDPSRLQPVTVTVPLHVNRSQEVVYAN